MLGLVGKSASSHSAAALSPTAELSIVEAVDAIMNKLGLDPAIRGARAVVDAAIAKLELGGEAVATSSMKEQLQLICSKLEIHTGWGQKVKQQQQQALARSAGQVERPSAAFVAQFEQGKVAEKAGEHAVRQESKTLTEPPSWAQTAQSLTKSLTDGASVAEIWVTPLHICIWFEPVSGRVLRSKLGRA